MENVIEILERIKADSSRTVKETILKQHKENEELRYVLDFLYNPYVITGLSKKKVNKKLSTERFLELPAEHKFENGLDVLEYLKAHNSGRDSDIAVVQYFLGTLMIPSEIVFFKELFTKSFKSGITAKTINKSFGEKFIPEFNVQLAKAYSDEANKLTGEFAVTEKLDGNRVVCVKESGTIKFFTRQGQPVLDLVEITAEIALLPDGFVYDGELLLKNEEGLSSDDLFRATQKVVRKDGEKMGLTFHIFDILTADEFHEGRSEVIYKKRRKKLMEIFASTFVQFKHLELVPLLYVGSDKNMIAHYLDQMILENKEGVMVNRVDGVYECKRTSNLLKVKKMHEIDERVIRLEEGTGKNTGKLGAVVIQYKEDYEVKVGSGFTDQEREYYWKNQNVLLGKIIAVSYFEESKNESGGLSLRFPVFKCVTGKDEPSYY
ncbi:RNA ligase family protein [Bacillus cereus]|uniref:ATP-dependent DNA ligase family profile domain-containing protein n=1 Tax=Bacillus cereus HuA3-9 TaxID=1053205 RepID=R8CI95_BACCE|nr:ATP-dependent DNA ligase [Bacillus cereus]EOO11317.1 hypothetical protein IGA_05580 [Bacillus cereus HuA3-9]